MSDDGAWAVVVIALVGNPFSAAYARARARAGERSDVRALDYCALNVAVYGPRNVWSLNERAIEDDARGADRLMIGSSAVAYDEGRLVVDIDERLTPFGGRGGRPLRGRITFTPEHVTRDALLLDDAGEHRWWPVAPAGRIEVTLDAPRISFAGHGYHDANAGDVPLEHTFRSWSWARARGTTATLVAYDAVQRSGATARHEIAIDGRGVSRTRSLARAALPASTWRLSRAAFADQGTSARVARSLEDGPFYARDLVASTWNGEPVVAMHETLSCDRLAASWVRFLSGFRTG